MTIAFTEMRSLDDERHFFALMGPFFASAQVRRECGGYALNDGPLYRWFVALDEEAQAALGFISVEFRKDHARLREGYVRPAARGRGLFRALREQVLARADADGLPCVAQVRRPDALLLERHGFVAQSSRGEWIQLQRAVRGQG